MNFKKYYQNNETYHTEFNFRLRKIIKITISLQPKNILDVGCGNGFLLTELSKRLKAEYMGVDVYKQPRQERWSYKCADITEGLPFGDNQFDCVIFGEVIEHVPNPDFLLKEIHRILKAGGHLIVSTPNLVSWANRFLVPLGIQPLYTETSSEVNLGRYFKAMGQGGKVQGHLKIFTHRSLSEILYMCKFQIIKKYGVPFFFPFPLSVLDRVLTRIIPLSSGLLFVAKKHEKKN